MKNAAYVLYAGFSAYVGLPRCQIYSRNTADVVVDKPLVYEATGGGAPTGRMALWSAVIVKNGDGSYALQ
ncbi:MAG: hypothetical protein LBL45_12650 [Treponema sp.]|jgi:hypothetical protein|nr:hypothetical protein [Treponema sp.]